MSTLAGAIVEAFGDRLATDFPGFSIVYGAPSSNGLGVEIGKSIRIHWAQARGVLSSSQLGGPVTVQPILAVTASRPFSGDSKTLEDHQATLDFLADLRLSVMGLVMDNATTSPIPALSGQAMWITDYTETPAVLNIGEDCATESVTIEITLNHSNTYGGR